MYQRRVSKALSRRRCCHFGKSHFFVSHGTSLMQTRVMVTGDRMQGAVAFTYDGSRSIYSTTKLQPTPEINSFISRIATLPAGPGVFLDAALRPSLDEEAELRKLFATDRQNSLLANPHVGLVDVFDAPDSIRMTRARIVQDKKDLFAKHVMPLSEENRRKEGTPCMVADLEEFKKNWAIFTEGSLSQLMDWNNVVAAGGSVLACLTPLKQEDKISKRATRKHYHSNVYPTSDVDLFLWGMTPEQVNLSLILGFCF